VVAQLGKRSLDRDAVARPVSIHEWAVEKPHAPAHAGHVLDRALREPLEIAQPVLGAGVDHQEGDVGHLLVVGEHERILAQRHLVARDLDANVVEPLGAGHAPAPPGVRRPAIECAEHLR
jgi:hypothetical protein